MYSYLHVCSSCNKPLLSERLFCNKCLPRLSLKRRKQFGLQHSYLFEYGENPILDALISQSKSGYFFKTLEEMLQPLRHFFLEESCILAMPNTNHTIKANNHSYQIARALWPSATIYEPFEKVGLKQATLNKNERTKAKIQLKEAVPPHQTYVLVDDVLTTGNTVYQAWTAMGFLPNTHIFTLAFTPRRD